MALNRERTGTMDMQGRPNNHNTRDHKKLNLFQRLASVATGGSNHNSSNHHRRSNQYRSHNHNSTGAMATSPAATSRSLTLSHARHHYPNHHVHHNAHQPHRNRHMTYASPTSSNVMDWLQSGECPSEILPNILAYAGPQVAASLSKTNHFWNDLLNEEAAWRVLCEELYKVRQCVELFVFVCWWNELCCLAMEGTHFSMFDDG